MINWNSTYSYDPDDKGGKTLFGVTENTWKDFVKKYPDIINSVTVQDIIKAYEKQEMRQKK
jgi:lysozyme family protein